METQVGDIHRSGMDTRQAPIAREEQEYVVPQMRTTRLPRSNGHWEGEAGNSLWHSDIEDVKTITGGEGIPFIGGKPDFIKWSQGSQTFKPGVLNGTNRDFSAVYRKLKADSNGRITSQNAAKRQLKTKGLTPHHATDTQIILVPTKLHSNIPHIGSASEMRRRRKK